MTDEFNARFETLRKTNVSYSTLGEGNDGVDQMMTKCKGR